MLWWYFEFMGNAGRARECGLCASVHHIRFGCCSGRAIEDWPVLNGIVRGCGPDHLPVWAIARPIKYLTVLHRVEVGKSLKTKCDEGGPTGAVELRAHDWSTSRTGHSDKPGRAGPFLQLIARQLQYGNYCQADGGRGPLRFVATVTCLTTPVLGLLQIISIVQTGRQILLQHKDLSTAQSNPAQRTSMVACLQV